MTDHDLFDRVLKGPWITAGDDVQYKLEDGLLYFQCSRGASDWRANFDFPVVPYRDMKDKFRVHRGFLAKWKSVRDVIRPLPFHTIVGFSHGAALAALAHEDRLFHLGVECTTTLFGCPRFLWMPSGVAQFAFVGVRRVSVRGDIVTHLPPAFTGYRHTHRFRIVGPWSIPRPQKHQPDEYRRYI